ncbi:MAG: Nucleotidyl transferase [Cenarchaeum symbiont of Oopsacas minuta]|nr:Nucleotidyl transferase [Cenarchaeum symbiont of Oopsacas minuta]
MPHTAVLMAGGCGTRGKPYTDFIPKVTIPIQGRPIIAYVTEYLASLPEISDIIILADFEGLGRQIRNYFGSKKILGKRLKFIQDSQSGTGGDLLHLRPHLGKGHFILWFADNICAVNIAQMLRTLYETNTHACVALRSLRKESTGFADLDGNIVKKFIEKPTVTLPMKECIGVYALSQDVLERISVAKRKKSSINLSYDILTPMAKDGLVSAYDIGKFIWIDAESPAVLERNSIDVKKALEQMSRVKIKSDLR